MPTPRELLERIHALPIENRVRLIHACGDHERMLELGGIRRNLPDTVELIAGPGCAASICPAGDMYQALQMVVRDDVTLMVDQSSLRMPVEGEGKGTYSLFEARAAGADVRVVDAPVEAVVAAKQDPKRDVVLFCTGFETIFGPLAGLIIDGLPDNLSLLLCGRRVQPLLDQILSRDEMSIDGLLLPGNRCALTGITGWDALARRHGIPAVVAGYSGDALLAAVHTLLRQHLDGKVGVTNLYRPLAREQGDPVSQDWLYRVFDTVDGVWRGVGTVPQSAFRLREAYAHYDAYRRHTDYRAEMPPNPKEVPAGCECPHIVLGQMSPPDCRGFIRGCQPNQPYGPCMASVSGTCYLRIGVNEAA